MGLGFISLFHFLFLYFLCGLAHIEEKCYLVHNCNWLHIHKLDHPSSVSHESHPKLDPHTHHSNALNSNKELKKGRDNHTFALGGSENNTSARLLFFGVFVALPVS